MVMPELFCMPIESVLESVTDIVSSVALEPDTSISMPPTVKMVSVVSETSLYAALAKEGRSSAIPVRAAMYFFILVKVWAAALLDGEP